MTPLALATRRSDDHLVTAARAGSSAAESEMVRRYRPALTRYCARIVGADLAEDAVNQALLQALVALRRHDRPFGPLHRRGRSKNAGSRIGACRC